MPRADLQQARPRFPYRRASMALKRFDHQYMLYLANVILA